uniref:Uncharacterized protein n=1 Tax=Aegilops tauschii subsp. strangulata TaxID=200361 RepID=A0A453N632_AEGTS
MYSYQCGLKESLPQPLCKKFFSFSLFKVAGIFGRDGILMHSSGEILLMNKRGVFMNSLQTGACYYLVLISI